MLENELRIDERSNGDEEDRDEHVSHGMHQSFDPARLARFRDERPHDERAKCNRISERIGEKRGSETKSDCADERRLVALELHNPSNESRHQKNADYHEPDEEGSKPDNSDRETPRRESGACRNRGEKSDENDGNQVFDDQNSEHHFANPADDVVLVERPRDDRCARDRHDSAGKNAFERGESEEIPGEVSEPHHRARLEERGQARRGRDLTDFLKPELEPEGEHEKDDAKLGQRLEHFLVGRKRYRQVRPDDHAGHQVAEYNRLPEPLEQERRYGRGAKDKRQVFQECVRVVHRGMIPIAQRPGQTHRLTGGMTSRTLYAKSSRKSHCPSKPTLLGRLSYTYGID